MILSSFPEHDGHWGPGLLWSPPVAIVERWEGNWYVRRVNDSRHAAEDPAVTDSTGRIVSLYSNCCKTF